MRSSFSLPASVLMAALLLTGNIVLSQEQAFELAMPGQPAPGDDGRGSDLEQTPTPPRLEPLTIPVVPAGSVPSTLYVCMVHLTDCRQCLGREGRESAALGALHGGLRVVAWHMANRQPMDGTKCLMPDFVRQLDSSVINVRKEFPG